MPSSNPGGSKQPWRHLEEPVLIADTLYLKLNVEEYSLLENNGKINLLIVSIKIRYKVNLFIALQKCLNIAQ